MMQDDVVGLSKTKAHLAPLFDDVLFHVLCKENQDAAYHDTHQQQCKNTT